GSMAWKDAYMNAEPVLLEPIMELEVTVPDDAVGAVNGDLNSRRGRLQGMEPLGGMTTIRAEVPMSELLTYAQSLTSMTGGRGASRMPFLASEDAPTHVPQKIIAETKREPEAAKAYPPGRFTSHRRRRAARTAPRTRRGVRSGRAPSRSPSRRLRDPPRR